MSTAVAAFLLAYIVGSAAWAILVTYQRDLLRRQNADLRRALVAARRGQYQYDD